MKPVSYTFRERLTDESEFHARRFCAWAAQEHGYGLELDGATVSVPEGVSFDQASLDALVAEYDTPCIVRGCTNRRWEGAFVGELCTPCRGHLEAGRWEALRERGSQI